MNLISYEIFHENQTFRTFFQTKMLDLHEGDKRFNNAVSNKIHVVQQSCFVGCKLSVLNDSYD